MESSVIVSQKVSFIDGAFSAAECQEFIERAEREGYGRGSDEPNSSDQRDRYYWYDVELAERIFQIVSSVPGVLVPKMRNGRTPVRVYDKMRLYKYGVGDSFKPHVDGGHVNRRPGPSQGESSVYTYVLYLNDGGDKENSGGESNPRSKKQGKYNNLEGGGTRFFNVPDWPRDVPSEVEAKTGRLLIFKQKDMVHEGCKILKGNKFIVQGMILYTPEQGQSGLPIQNFFTVVETAEQKIQQDPIKTLKSMKSKSTILGIDDETEYDRLVRMSKAGHPVEALARFVLFAGIPEDQVANVTQQIVAEAAELQRNRTDEQPSEEDPSSLININNSFVHCRFYKMLKAGLTADQVFQLMTVVSKIPDESARNYLNHLLAQLE